MKYVFDFLFVLLSFLFLNSAVNAQNNKQNFNNPDSLRKFRSAGAITGYGLCLDPDTYYQPIFFAGDFSWSFKKKLKRNFWAWYFEPQFNLVRTNRPPDFEFGGNLGIRHYIKYSDNFYFYQMLGSGPHYITADIVRQAKGYIFSDNLAVGAYTRLGKRSLFLNIQLRLRHISNAGLKHPNGGIDTFNFIVGFSKFK